MDADTIWEYAGESREELHAELERATRELVSTEEELQQAREQMESLREFERRQLRHLEFLTEYKRTVHAMLDELIGLDLAAKALQKSGDLEENYDILGYPPGYWSEGTGTGTEVGIGSGCLPEIPLKKETE